MPERARLRSLAKINLDLRVLGKRPDGFHELRTIFQTISLADTLEVEYQRGRSKIELESSINIPGNLVLRAADVVMKALRATGRLRSRTPVEAKSSADARVCWSSRTLSGQACR